jgi:hypothetical protein
MTDEQFDHSLSNNERTKNIRENRKTEKRKRGNPRRLIGYTSTVELIINKYCLSPEEVETYKYPPTLILRKKQQDVGAKKMSKK